MKSESKKKCSFWHGHNWNKWGILNDGKSTPIANTRTKAIVGQMFIQQRMCEDCGLSQFQKDCIDVND